MRDKAEGLVIVDVRHIGIRREEQRIWHLTPHCSCLQRCLGKSPVVEEPSLQDFQFGEVKIILASQESLDAPGVSNADARSLSIYRQLGVGYVVIALGGVILHLCSQFGGSYRTKSHIACCLVLLMGNTKFVRHSVLLVTLERQFLHTVEHTVGVGAPSQRTEQVVIVAIAYAIIAAIAAATLAVLPVSISTTLLVLQI